MVPVLETLSRLFQVIVAEDNPADAALVMEAFKNSKRPVEVVPLKNGDQVMDYLRGKGGSKPVRLPDLILLDLYLPGKSGFEVIKEIKANPRLRDIPVVVLTNSQSLKDVNRALKAGADSYLKKLPEFEDFRSALQKVKERWLEEEPVQRNETGSGLEGRVGF